MDAYTVFALFMSLTGGTALTFAVLIYLDARRDMSAFNDNVRFWCGRLEQDRVASDLLRTKVEQALAERVRNLETYRVNHAQRLNQVEDLVESERQRADLVSVTDPGITPMDMEIIDVQAAVRGEWDRARMLETYTYATDLMPEQAGNDCVERPDGDDIQSPGNSVAFVQLQGL